MKKSTLALSIAAAIGGFGLAGNALAVEGTLAGATASSSMARNDGGVGHQLIFPYYTAQNGNATLLSITNTDTTHAKVVKVRFRGAANSDDVYDFQVLMSPGDVWTGAVTKNATTGVAQLATSDKSCTLPSSVNSDFVKLRLDGQDAAQTLEGYVEVINMADVVNPTATTTLVGADLAARNLFTAIKHVNGTAPCTPATLSTALGTDGTDAALRLRGLSSPTTGLTGDWIILNQNTTAAWSGSATALEVRDAQGPATGNLVFFPQILGDVDTTAAQAFTADPLITSGVLTAQMYDLPDMSTPYAANANPAAQADDTTAELAVRSVANQYVTSDDIAAVTDIMFSQPMRRYSAVVNYTASTVTDGNGNTLQVPLAKNGTMARALYRGASETGLTESTINNVVYMVAAATTNATAAVNLATAVGTGSIYYGPSTGTTANMATNLLFSTANPRILCLNTIAGPGNNTIFDREETTPAAPGATTTTATFVISPNASTTSATPVLGICGEAAVLSINGAGSDSALSASIARNDITAASGYENGWLTINTAAAGNVNGLPIIGQSFIRAANGNVNYGFGYTNKVTR